VTTYPYMLGSEPVARALNISVSSLYKLAREERLPFSAEKLGKLYRFKRAEVENYLGASLDEVLGSPEQFVNLADEAERIDGE
jgi:excisionase family DNA binding protein